jgi:site-specific DNA-cytosine methylase
MFENVLSNDSIWGTMQRYFQDIGYATQVIPVDTKDFYIPHTRKRRYMLYLNKEVYGEDNNDMKRQWIENMNRFKSHASVPLTEFPLPAHGSCIMSLAA